MARAATAHIHLDAIRHNYRFAKAQAPGKQAFAVIKADAYGHGAIPVAQALAPEADAFAVASLEEALELIDGGIDQPILLLEGFFTADELPLISQHNIWCGLHCHEQLAQLFAANITQPINIWLKLDTGMHRLGFTAEEALPVYQQLKAMPQVNQISLMTHLACADEPEHPLTALQLERFQQVAGQLPVAASIANSAGTLAHPGSLADWQRPGIMLYGASPFVESHPAAAELEAAMTLSSEIIAIHNLQPGESIGYGATWVCDRATRVGTVAMGYADGYPRHAGSGTPVAIAGQPSRLLGRVSMDMLTVDLTGLPQIGIGASVELWGKQIAANRVADCAATIPYTLFTGVTKRVPRVYQD